MAYSTVPPTTSIGGNVVAAWQRSITTVDTTTRAVYQTWETIAETIGWLDLFGSSNRIGQDARTSDVTYDAVYGLNNWSYILDWEGHDGYEWDGEELCSLTLATTRLKIGNRTFLPQVIDDPGFLQDHVEVYMSEIMGPEGNE